MLLHGRASAQNSLPCTDGWLRVGTTLCHGMLVGFVATHVVGLAPLHLFAVLRLTLVVYSAVHAVCIASSTSVMVHPLPVAVPAIPALPRHQASFVVVRVTDVAIPRSGASHMLSSCLRQRLFPRTRVE